MKHVIIGNGIAGVCAADMAGPGLKLLTSGLKDVVGATFAVEPDPEKAAIFLRRHIEDKRKALGLDARNVE